MTIYSLINNSPSPEANAAAESPCWTILSAASVLQGGNPFFVPDFDSSFEARPAIALKIGKLGKGIAPRFAHRYVESVAPCVHFIAPGLLEALQRNGLPWTKAVCFDRCLCLGKFMPIPFDEIVESTISAIVSTPDGTQSRHSLRVRDIPFSIESAIHELSRDNTLKTGDIIILSSAPGPLAIPGQRVTMSINGTGAGAFNIR